MAKKTRKEGAIQRQLIDDLIACFPDIYIRKIQQSTFSHAGVPDLIGCLSGMFFAIEVKTENGVVSALQERELSLIDEADGISFICKGFKDIDRITYELYVLRQKSVQASALNHKLHAKEQERL